MDLLKKTKQFDHVPAQEKQHRSLILNLPTLNSSTGSSGSWLFPVRYKKEERRLLLAPCDVKVCEEHGLPW